MEVVFYMSHLAKVLVGLIALAMVSMPVSAEEAGLSGECYNEDGTEGGQGRVNVNTDTQDVDGLTVDEALSIANALALFATNTQNRPNQCAQDDTNDGLGGGRHDYLEVHAGDAQVCYQGSTQAEDMVFVGERGCRTTPNGPA